MCRRTDNIQPMKDPKANARGSRQKVERKEKENVGLSCKQAGCDAKPEKKKDKNAKTWAGLSKRGLHRFRNTRKTKKKKKK